MSRSDKRYRTGVEVEPNTFVSIKDTFDPEVPHHFYSPEELITVIGGYEDGKFDPNLLLSGFYRFEVHKTPMEIQEIADMEHDFFRHIYLIATKGVLLFVPPHLFGKISKQEDHL